MKLIIESTGVDISAIVNGTARNIVESIAAAMLEDDMLARLIKGAVEMYEKSNKEDSDESDSGLQFPINLTDKIQLTDIDVADFVDWESMEVESFKLSFKFYDCCYTAVVGKDDFEEDWPSFRTSEGDGDLFDSFYETIQEDEVFEKIKAACLQWEKENKEEV